MAKIPLQKVALYVHYSERERLLSRLQDEEIFHFSEVSKEIKDEYNTHHPAEEAFESHLESLIHRLENAIRFLEPYARKKSFIDNLIERKEPVSLGDFVKIANCIEPGAILIQTETLEQELNQLNQIESNLKAQIEFISPWVNLQYPVEMIKASGEVIYLAGTFPSRYKDILEKSPIGLQIVSDDGKRCYVVVVYLRKDEDNVRQILQEVEFEQVEFHGFTGLPRDILSELQSKLTSVLNEKESIGELVREVSKRFKELLVLRDYYYGIYRRELVDNKGVKTSFSAIYTGYVRKADLPKFEEILKDFPTAYFELLIPEKDEQVPVLIENKRGFKPFEGLVKMYGLPSESDPDPTPLIAPFFILFFGICFGDAAYGVILTILSYLIMRKLKISGGLPLILIMGGIASFIFGLLTGGWFGDFLERANIVSLNQLRKKLMLFDPMQDVLVFFGLTILLGFIQVIVGLFVNGLKKIKEGDILGAISLPFAWIVVLISLLYKFALARRLENPLLDKVSLILIAISILLMVLFSSWRSRNFIIRIIKGAYNVYNGVGFLGDLLSYVRLMALGLTSSGIAMAINILTLLVWQIPVLGFVLAPIVFIFGHLFSVVINILGSIVHPLRLQYVEFFKQFYDDGGISFDPLGWTGKYTEIVNNIKQEV